jgi:carbonic anhydrase
VNTIEGTRRQRDGTGDREALELACSAIVETCNDTGTGPEREINADIGSTPASSDRARITIRSFHDTECMNAAFIDLLRDNATHASEFDSRFDDVQDSQRPEVVSVCCSDSRVLQDHMWGNDQPGRVFTASNIGNRTIQRSGGREFVSGDVLYPIAHTGTETAVVTGHTGCGAVTATYQALTGDLSEPPGIEHCLNLLKPHLEPGVAALSDGLAAETAVNRLVEYNVDRQVEFLLESDTVPDSVEVVGVVYDFQDIYSGKRGEVHVVNVDGETDVETLRKANTEVASRIERLWEY